MTLLRIALQVVVFFLLLGIAMAIGTSDTGVLEKAVLVVAGIALVWFAIWLRTWRSAPPWSSASPPRG